MFEIITVDELLSRLNGYSHNELHVHHTWSPRHSDFNGSNGLELQQGMKNYHVNNLGWADIGQHVTLLPDGLFVTGRDFGKTPASISGQNIGAFAMEMLGNFDSGNDLFQGEQKNSALKVAKYFIDRGRYVRFHRENSPKTCPGTSIDKDTFMSEAKNFGIAPVEVQPQPTPQSAPIVKKTWHDYIVEPISGQLQAAINAVYGTNIDVDNKLGDQTFGAIKDNHVVVRAVQANPLVAVIQKRLMQLGYGLSRYGADGKISKGGETEKAIIRFQTNKGLTVDGEAGINTIKELFKK